MRRVFFGDHVMWKILVGFVVFAAIVLYVIIQGGDKVDMSGEKHGADAVHGSDTNKKPADQDSPKK